MHNFIRVVLYETIGRPNIFMKIKHIFRSYSIAITNERNVNDA